MKLIKKFYSGVTIFRRTIQSKRSRMLTNPDICALLRAAHISGAMGESFETFIKSMK